MNRLLGFLLLTGASLGADSQEKDAEARESGRDDTRSPWAFGVGTIVSDSAYAGERSRVIPVPVVSYLGERFFIRGVSIGYQLFKDDAIQLDLLGKYRFAAFEVDDLGASELASNGIEPRLLEDRDGGVDLGFGMKWTGIAGELDFELLADATNTSGGQEVKLEYSYPISVGLGRLSPSTGITWMSQDLANYAFGTLDSEVARGVVDYRPGAATIPQVGLSFAHPLSRKWFFFGSVRYAVLPDKIRQSPLIEDGVDGEASLLLFFTRGL